MKSVGNNGRNTLTRFIKQKSVLTFITLIFFLASGGNSWSLEGEPLSYKSTDSQLKTGAAVDKLISKAREKGRIRVIVGLNTTFVPEGQIKTAQSINAQRINISRLQDSLLESMGALNPSVVKKFKYIPFMAMEVDEGMLSALISHNLVKTIGEDRLNQPMLTQSVPLIGADKAWTSGFTGTGWAVAILDSGVDATHDMLSGKVVEEACYSTNYSQGQISSLCPNGLTSQTGPGSGIYCTVNESCWHGTHVAGIAAGKNYGVAKDADIIAIQVFSRIDDPSSCGQNPVPCILTLDSDVLSALERVYELRNTYNIAAVNMSLGGGKYPSYCDFTDSSTAAYRTKIDNLRSAGIASVVASGNDGYADGIGAPACISTAVSVGATTKQDTVADFSNSANFLSLLAPGAEIVSSVPDNLYAGMNGTSQATPHVAGTWAILKQLAPTASVGELLSLIQSTGKSIYDLRNGVITPRIQVDSALYVKNSCITTVSSDLRMNLPVASFEGSFYWGNFQYYPTSDGSTWFKLIDYGLIAQGNCSNPVTLLPNSNRLHFPAVIYEGVSYWADLDYQITPSDEFLIKLINYAPN